MTLGVRKNSPKTRRRSISTDTNQNKHTSHEEAQSESLLSEYGMTNSSTTLRSFGRSISFVVPLLLVGRLRERCDAFVIPVLPSSHCCRHRVSSTTTTTTSPLPLFQQKDDKYDDDDDDDDLLGNNDDEEEYDDENEPVDASWGEGKLNALYNAKLGIGNLISFTSRDVSDITAKAAEVLDEAYTSEINAIESIKDELRTAAREGRAMMDVTSALNRRFVMDNLATKIDALTSDFLSSAASGRDDINRLVTADEYTSNTGMGVSYGSWGNVGDGEVGIDAAATATTASGGGGALLGSVEQSQQQQQQQQQNRVLIIADTKKDKSSLLIITELSTLLHETFQHPSTITIDIVTPNTVPMGGHGAQTVVLFSTALDTLTRSSFDSIITNGVLKRTAPVAGRDPIRPPSHVVLISAHGTERTNKLPYSMMNLVGSGKLDKLRDVERGLVALSRSGGGGGGGSSSRAVALDYTIIKFGSIETKYDNNKDSSSSSRIGDANDNDVMIRYGDVLDGGIGPKAAANVILQSTVYQPYARNTTLCAQQQQQEGDGRGSSSIMMLVDDDDTTTATSSGSDSSMMMMLWNDKFLCLSGPELLRINVVVNKKETATSNYYESLLSYITLWSETYDSSSSGTIPKKGTGLTTPAIVRPSRQQPSIYYDGVANRSGVRILFRPTNTGDRYKSATEERSDEKTRNTSISSSGAAKKGGATVLLPMSKERKEGGVEVLVERTLSGTVRVRARRCNIDDKTIVKEMSEDVIISSLKKAMDAWIISQPS